MQDASGQIQAVWPNQAFLKDVIRPHQQIVLYGKAEYWGSRGMQITDPEFEILRDAEPASRRSTLHTGRIVPVYERTGSVTTNMQRRLVWDALDAAAGATVRSACRPTSCAREAWPERDARARQRAFSRGDTAVDALNTFPTPAQRRLIFEDFFVFQSGLALRRQQNAQVRKALVPPVTIAIRHAARAVLPFKLTDGQRQALAEIVADMQKPWPMQRLLQGDVGAGKTIVALLAALVAMENGFQVGVHGADRDSRRAASRRRCRAGWRRPAIASRCSAAASPRPIGATLLPAIERGDVHLVVGTHALVQEQVKFRALASRSSTSSIVSACCSARRSRARACTRTCW